MNMWKGNYKISIKRKSLTDNLTSTIIFDTPNTLEETLTKLLEEESIKNAENTMIKLEIINLKLQTNESK